MSLIKLRNDGEAIFFIDSLGLTIRPKEVKLFDENTAKNDGQLMGLVVLGKIRICGIDEDFDSEKPKEKTKEEIPVQATEPSIKITGGEMPVQEVKQDLATPEQTAEIKKQAAKSRVAENEPKNTTPVVMFGERPGKRGLSKMSNIDLPDYINPDDIIGSDPEDDPLIGDIRDSDILYADDSDKIDIGEVGMVDARD